MYQTKLTVELIVETQFGPNDAVNMVDVLTRVPAIKAVDVVKLETDYKPSGFVEDVNFKVMNNVPCKIR